MDFYKVLQYLSVLRLIMTTAKITVTNDYNTTEHYYSLIDHC